MNATNKAPKPKTPKNGAKPKEPRPANGALGSRHDHRRAFDDLLDAASGAQPKR